MWKKHWLTEVNDNNVAPVSGRGFILGDWIVKKKNCFVAYFAWLFGLHGFYCGKPFLNILMFAFCFIGALAFSVDGGFTLGIYWLALLVQAFLIPSWVREANQQAQKEYEDMIAQAIKKARIENV